MIARHRTAGRARAHAVDASPQQAGEVVPVSGRRHPARVCGGHFVADLHHLGQDAGRAKGGDTVARQMKTASTIFAWT